MHKYASSRVAVVIALVAVAAAAQTWPVGLTSTLSFGPPGFGPPGLGGVAFNASGTQLVVVGSATGAGATAYSYTPTRDPGTSRITGLSQGTGYAPTAGADGGLALYGGLVWWSTYPGNQIGQYNTMTAQTVMTTLPSALNTTGGCTIVPAGYPNAGTLLVSSYSVGDIYAFPLTPAANGFYSLGAPTLWANLVSGSEGMAFVSSGPLAGHLLVANYAYSRVDAIPVSAATGLPAGGSATPTVIPVITGLGGVEGVGIDPVTGDPFISTYGAATLFRVDGFGTFTAIAAEHPSFTVGGGATIKLFVRAGSGNANRPYAIAASGSGTTPGVPIGPVTVPLNIDPFTNFVIQNWNTPLFSNFVATTNPFGAATATINIPPVMIGGPIGLDFAAVLLNPVDFATNAVHVVLLP